jgi:hypothetical protein
MLEQLLGTVSLWSQAATGELLTGRRGWGNRSASVVGDAANPTRGLHQRPAGRSASMAHRGEDPPRRRMDVSTEDYFTRSKTRCDAIEPIMPSTVMVFPSALRVVLDVPVPPGPATEPS